MREFDAKPVSSTNIRAALGESPLWDPEVGLRWLDVTGRRLLSLSRDRHVTSLALTDTVKSIQLNQQGGLLAVTVAGFATLDTVSGRVRQIARVVDGNTVTMNDGAIDCRGRWWAGSAVRDHSWKGALYCLDGTGLNVHVERLGMSNGLDWSVGNDFFYHVDSTAGLVTAWDYDARFGKLSRRRPLRTVPPDIGLPDGLTVDDSGNIWLAIWGAGQVWCLDATSGSTNAVVHVPTPYTTSCAFGDPELSSLYITTANYRQPPGGGLLYVADVCARGRVSNRFAGASW